MAAEARPASILETPAGVPRPATDAPPRETAALAMAEARVATLERTLMRTLRENARNRLRAEKAEAALARHGIDVDRLPHPDAPGSTDPA